MNILIIASWYPNEKHPNNGIFFHEQARSLVNGKNNVFVIYPNFISFKISDMIKYSDNSLKIIEKYEDHFYSFGFPKFHYKKTLFFYYFLKKIYKTIVKKYGKIEVIHAHSILYAGYNGAKLAKKLNIPFVITEHSSRYLKNWNFKKYGKKIDYTFSAAQKIFFVSRKLMCAFDGFSMFKSKFEVFPNFIQDNFFDRKNIKPTTPIKIGYFFLFLSIGNLKPDKGYDLLIQAFSNKFRKDDNVLLVIGGTGEQEMFLRQMVKDRNRQNQIYLLGELDRKEVEQWMEMCDCFVSSSRFETFGVVIAEALAKGKPVLATKSGGPEDLINSCNGILIEKESISSLEKGLLEMYQNIKFFDSEKIKMQAFLSYSQSEMSKRLRNTYKALISEFRVSN